MVKRSLGIRVKTGRCQVPREGGGMRKEGEHVGREARPQKLCKTPGWQVLLGTSQLAAGPQP